MAPFAARSLLGVSAAASSGLPTIAIAGFVVAGVIALLAFIWVIVRFIRKRAQRKREDARGAAFLSVKGIVKEGAEDLYEKKDPFSRPALPLNGPTFSRAQINGVVMPSKAFLPANATRDEIVAYHTETATLPKPFHFALSAASGAPEPAFDSTAGGHARAPSADRRSWRSSLFALGGGLGRGSQSSPSFRDSVASTISVSSGGGDRRKVRQLFAPVLPDELVLSLGEGITVLHSYDDGWCIVGRADTASPFAAAATASQGSAFGQGKRVAQECAEVGAVPAWVFIKPVKGLRAERPLRSSSLGVTIAADAPAGARPDLMSWSNF